MKKTIASFRNFALNLKLVGGLPILGSFFILSLFLTFYMLENQIDPTYLHRVIEVVVPLIFGLQTAFLLAPEGEATMELLLSCPKPLDTIFLERLFVISVAHGSVALAATIIASNFPGGEAFLLALIRWLAASVILGGVAAFTTQLTRQSAFGALMVTFLWCADLYGGDLLLERLPVFWPIHIYLQPQNALLEVFLLNRLSLIFIGSLLILMARTLLRKDERVLGIK